MIYESSDCISEFPCHPAGYGAHALPHHAGGERQGDGVPSAWTMPPSEFYQ